MYIEKIFQDAADSIDKGLKANEYQLIIYDTQVALFFFSVKTDGLQLFLDHVVSLCDK